MILVRGRRTISENGDEEKWFFECKRKCYSWVFVFHTDKCNKRKISTVETF